MCLALFGNEAGQFVPAAKFDGAEPGYVFKIGAQGLGYYKDVVALAVSTHWLPIMKDPTSTSVKCRQTNGMMEDSRRAANVRIFTQKECDIGCDYRLLATNVLYIVDCVIRF